MFGAALARSLVVDNPVVRREARLRFWRAWRTDQKLAGIIAVTGGLTEVAVFIVRPDRAGMLVETRRGLMLCYGAMLAIMTALIGARSIAGEREVRTWEQVLITRLRPAHLIAGKIIGVALPALLILAVTTPAVIAVMTHFDAPPLSNPYGGPVRRAPSVVEMLFLPPPALSPIGGNWGYSQATNLGLFWLFIGIILWVMQGATAGVFASLRYRSTVASGVSAMLLLALALGLNLTFVEAGALSIAQGEPAVRLILDLLVTALVYWGWPLVTILVMFGLAVYEFREFDRWLQAGAGG